MSVKLHLMELVLQQNLVVLHTLRFAQVISNFYDSYSFLASIPHLFVMINAADCRNEENIMATENSISALGKIIRSYKDSGLFDSNSVISMWIGSLPIIEDCEEAPATYQLLLDLIMQQHPAVVNATQATKLVSILTQVLPITALLQNDPELSQQLLTALRSIVPVCNKQELISCLSNEQQQYLASQQGL